MKGVLLVNLGSPDAPTPEAVKPYLDEFLMDERVIDLPYLLRAFVVRGIILRKRPAKSAEAYQKIWWDEGSPLIVLSKRTQKKVQERVVVPVVLAMRYGNPSIEAGLQELYGKGVRDVLLFPLYPQFAMATTETILVLAEKIRKQKFPDMKFSQINSFYNREGYTEELAKVVQESLVGYDYDKLLFSYHGVPERHIKKSDVTKSHCTIDDSCCTLKSAAHEFCYRHQCFETTRLVTEHLGVPKEKYIQTFQSRLGIDKWLQPFTDETVEKLAKEGVKKLAVVTPAFVADCIETLEEIEMEAGKAFKENGGEEFKMIPCLNDRDSWMDVMALWIKEWIAKN
ncbi:MAG TPA: ferrochelatase [Flavobacterium sp.]|nr:ferrochelatase [Flavobacterium sp.]